MMSSDQEVADKALTTIVEQLVAGRIIVDPPLPKADQQTLRELTDKMLMRKRH
jgi:hypothetical protein